MNGIIAIILMILGVLGVVIMGASSAFGAGNCENNWRVLHGISCNISLTIDYLEQILDEEKKQTALLTQQNCYMLNEFHEASNSGLLKLSGPSRLAEKCGMPLNYTGMWND